MNLELSPKEVNVIAMGLNVIIEDTETGLKNPIIPWTPEARKDLKEILEHARTVKAKLEQATGKDMDLPPYEDGDEKEFLTKES